MDVTCERCSTAYEFDDALVSERGTTVKCTTCGHQFKVRRSQSIGAPERWMVRTIDGRELEFRALRELQAAIAQATITRDDVLSRGGSRPRRLGSIAELEPFFVGAATAGSQATTPSVGSKAPPRVRSSNPTGIYVATTSSRPETSVVIPLPGSARIDIPSYAPTTGMQSMSAGAPPAFVHTAESPMVADAPVQRSAAPLPPRSTPPPKPLPPAPVPVSARRDDWAVEPALTPQPVLDDPPETLVPSSVLPVSSEPSSDFLSSPVHTPSPSLIRSSYGSEEAYAEPRFSAVVSSRSAGAARWMIGFFVGGMVTLVAVTMGRRMLVSGATAKIGEADGRIGTLLADGEKSLLDGDLELAKEHFDKASALAERNARVAIDLAKLAGDKADVDWLRVRLLAVDDPEQVSLHRELEVAVQRARRAADHAAEIAPADPGVARARIDALRLAGDLDGARKLVGAIADATSQPDNALVLAELEVAEAKPDWSTVVGRLRAAVSSGGNHGRARAMLVYALARSGEPSAARVELERLSALARPHPLVGALTAYLARTDKTMDASGLPDARGSAFKSATPNAASATRELKEPRERLMEPKLVSPVPDPVAPTRAFPPAGPLDTSDLPGVRSPVSPSPTSTTPGVDTSDLPGLK